MGCNRTGPPCSVGRPTAYAADPAAAGRVAADRPRARRQARPPAGSNTDDDRHQWPLLVWPPTICVGRPLASNNDSIKAWKCWWSKVYQTVTTAIAKLEDGLWHPSVDVDVFANTDLNQDLTLIKQDSLNWADLIKHSCSQTLNS